MGWPEGVAPGEVEKSSNNGQLHANTWFTTSGMGLESIAVTVNTKLPRASGVPKNTPAALKDRPGEDLDLVTVQVRPPSPPEAVSVKLYASPTLPLGTLVDVMPSGFSRRDHNRQPSSM